MQDLRILRVWSPFAVQPGNLVTHSACQLSTHQSFAEECQRQFLARSLQKGEPNMSAPESSPEEGPKAKRANPRSHYRADGTRRRTKGEKKARQGHGAGHHSSGWTSDWWQKESQHGSRARYPAEEEHPAEQEADAADVASSSGQRGAGTTRQGRGEGYYTSDWQADWWESSTGSKDTRAQNPAKEEREDGEPEDTEAASSFVERPTPIRDPPLSTRNSLLVRIPEGQGIPQLRERLTEIQQTSGLLHVLLSSKPKDGRWTLLLEGTKAGQDKAKEQIMRIMVQAQREPPTPVGSSTALVAQAASTEGADPPAPTPLPPLPPSLPLSAPPGPQIVEEPALDASPQATLSTSELHVDAQRPSANNAEEALVVAELPKQQPQQDQTVRDNASSVYMLRVLAMGRATFASMLVSSECAFCSQLLLQGRAEIFYIAGALQRTFSGDHHNVALLTDDSSGPGPGAGGCPAATALKHSDPSHRMRSRGWARLRYREGRHTRLRKRRMRLLTATPLAWVVILAICLACCRAPAFLMIHLAPLYRSLPLYIQRWYYHRRSQRSQSPRKQMRFSVIWTTLHHCSPRQKHNQTDAFPLHRSSHPGTKPGAGPSTSTLRYEQVFRRCRWLFWIFFFLSLHPALGVGESRVEAHTSGVSEAGVSLPNKHALPCEGAGAAGQSEAHPSASLAYPWSAKRAFRRARARAAKGPYHVQRPALHCQ